MISSDESQFVFSFSGFHSDLFWICRWFYRLISLRGERGSDAMRIGAPFCRKRLGLEGVLKALGSPFPKALKGWPRVALAHLHK
jgi:hypothetical protein